jgi:hypothetical protein
MQLHRQVRPAAEAHNAAAWHIVDTERSTHPGCSWQAGDAISGPLRLLVSSTVRCSRVSQPY